jgi:hypothetical protein
MLVKAHLEMVRNKNAYAGMLAAIQAFGDADSLVKQYAEYSVDK